LRYERKYRIEVLSPDLVNQGLKLHPSGFRKLYPERQVNNIYFDSIGFNTYKENVAGLEQRQKFRVRWYGSDVLNIDNAVLEIKLRQNNLGDKISIPIKGFSFLNIGDLIAQVNHLCPKTSGVLRPTLFNSYERNYWTSPDHHFRITVDTELKYAPMIPEAFIGRQLLHDRFVSILELKYDEAQDAMADRITQYLPYRLSKNSKYVNGINLCYL
jgi:hypothetical protein